MKTRDAPAAKPEIRGNDLARLQLKIARRADQLSRHVISDPVTDVALWLQAEEEIFTRSKAEAE